MTPGGGWPTPECCRPTGAFAVLVEMVPGDVAAQVTTTSEVPTVGIGAGEDCDARPLVRQDMAGLRTGRLARFVKRYADLHVVLSRAARGCAPGGEHTF